jgi:hypothetical protein
LTVLRTGCYTTAAATEKLRLPDQRNTMGSFDITYDADEDFMEVTFAVFDENLSRTVSLNDHIFLFTDLGLQAVWGITFYSYRRLLGVSETDLTSLKELPEPQVEAILNLLRTPPASLFFNVTYPDSLLARVNAPSIDALIGDDS